MEKKSVQKKYMVLALIFGMLFVFLTPPLQSPDEDSHLKKAYVMAEGQFVPDVLDGHEGFYLSKAISDYIVYMQKMMGDTDRKITYTELVSSEKMPTEYEDEEFIDFSTLKTNVVGHIVPAVGIVIGKIVSILAGREPSIVFLLYFARMANLFMYILVVGVSISITPILKKTFCMLGLMPMALYIGSSVSYDALLICLAFLFAALWIRLMFDGKCIFNLRHAVAFGVIGFVFFVLKIVYMPMFILLLFIPREKFETTFLKNLKISNKVIWITFAIIVALGLVGATKIPFLFRDTVESGMDPLVKKQIMFAIENPVECLKIILQSIKSERDYYISSMIGIFGLVDTQLFSVFIYTYLGVFILTGISDISITKRTIKVYQSITILGTILISVLGIFMAMYLLWTPLMPGYGVGATSVNGVQGRYFIPLLPLLFLVFSNNSLCKNVHLKKICELVLEYSLYFSIAILIISEVTILLRFWV